MFCFEGVYVIGCYSILKVTVFLVVHSLFFQSLELSCNMTDTWSNMGFSCVLAFTYNTPFTLSVFPQSNWEFTNFQVSL
jgi:hypothetical protein